MSACAGCARAVAGRARDVAVASRASRKALRVWTRAPVARGGAERDIDGFAAPVVEGPVSAMLGSGGSALPSAGESNSRGLLSGDNGCGFSAKTVGAGVASLTTTTGTIGSIDAARGASGAAPLCTAAGRLWLDRSIAGSGAAVAAAVTFAEATAAAEAPVSRPCPLSRQRVVDGGSGSLAVAVGRCDAPSFTMATSVVFGATAGTREAGAPLSVPPCGATSTTAGIGAAIFAEATGAVVDGPAARDVPSA